MKTSSILLAAAFILLPFCFSPLFAQEQNAAPEKKITIIKRSVEADGTEVTETIVKKGKAAENFDVDKFVQENRDDKNNVEVIVSEVEDEQNAQPFKNFMKNFYCVSTCTDNGAFLGVTEDSDEDESQPGLVVQITRGSAADKAGLRDNDKILSLNGTKTDKWSDLSTVIQASKPGDKLQIAYSRNGKEAATEAVLTTRTDVKCDVVNNPKGVLGVSENDDDDSENGVAVTISQNSAVAKAGLVSGDAIVQLNDTPISDFEDITDFMAYSKPGEKVMVGYIHEGQRKNVEVELGEQKGLMKLQDFDIQVPEINLKGLGDLNALPRTNLDYKIKEKEACLGVYSSGLEDRGAAIQSFTQESAAQEAGMQEGDLILSVNNVSVTSHSELWDEIAKYKTGDKVQVAYEREGKPLQIEATLKACKDKSRVEIIEKNANGQDLDRRFYTWNWDQSDQRRLKETRIIIIRKAGEGDGTKVNLNPNEKPAQDRSLALQSFRAYPNPSQGQITVEFKGEPVATIVSLLDMSGRQLFREELNAFNGSYNQQFDLTAYAKGTILIHVLQGDKVYTEQVIVN
jgi:S1-C subfamily serine protease